MQLQTLTVSISILLYPQTIPNLVEAVCGSPSSLANNFIKESATGKKINSHLLSTDSTLTNHSSPLNKNYSICQIRRTMKRVMQSYAIKQHPSCKKFQFKRSSHSTCPHCKTNPKKPKSFNQSNKAAVLIKREIQADNSTQF